MTTLYFLVASACRLLGLIRAADFFWQKHELRKAQNAQQDINSMDDHAVSDKLQQRGEYRD